MNSRPWFYEGIFGIPAKTALAKLLLQDSCSPHVLMGFAEVKSYLFIFDYLIFYLLSLNVEYPPDSINCKGVVNAVFCPYINIFVIEEVFGSPNLI